MDGSRRHTEGVVEQFIVSLISYQENCHEEDCDERFQ